MPLITKKCSACEKWNAHKNCSAHGCRQVWYCEACMIEHVKAHTHEPPEEPKAPSPNPVPVEERPLPSPNPVPTVDMKPKMDTGRRPGSSEDQPARWHSEGM